MLVDSHTSPTLLVVRLCHSNRRFWHWGLLTCRGYGIPQLPCGSCACLYVHLSSPAGANLLKQDARPLSWPALVAGIHQALVSAGVDVSRLVAIVSGLGLPHCSSSWAYGLPHPDPGAVAVLCIFVIHPNTAS